MTKIRTRFAPSPTGFAHVGNLRTALFAYLTARHDGGDFILRLEDTDKNREVEGADDYILWVVKELGLQYDEGPDVGGPFAPYRQSERLEHYIEWGRKLVAAGRAYADPYTQDELQKFREEATANKQAFLYRDHRPANPPEWDGTQPLRFKSEPKDYLWHDEVMGDLHAGKEAIDDFVLIKSDGYPTYNFAHIVDDYEMKVTHVIRGQEFISSMPNYLNLYEALKIEWPVFAHMPHILNETGNKKLGKRDGAKDAMDYLRDGIVVEALVNFIASMGWNDGSEQEIFSKDELVKKFSLDRVGRSGARFDEKRLIWMNSQWIKRLTLDDLYQRVEGFWGDAGMAASSDERTAVLAVAQDRLKTLKDLPNLSEYFFHRPAVNWQIALGDKQLGKLTKDELARILKKSIAKLEGTEWTEEAIQTALNELLVELDLKPMVAFSVIRFALTWAPFSPGLPETMTLLGKKESLTRLELALA